MTNRRTRIVTELAELIKTNLNGNSPYTSNIYENVNNRQVFWDEIEDYPTICIYPGAEAREYLPGDFKWAFLTINIRIYVNDEDAKLRLEEVFDDLEYLLDNNNTLTIDGNDLCTDIRILSISDDEGILNPIGVGEMTLEVRYDV